MTLDITLHRNDIGDRGLLAFDVNALARAEVWSFVDTVGEKTNDYFRLRLDKPFRPRTTGYRSQNSRHWGHCDNIAKQISGEGQHYSKDDIDGALRRMAVSEGLRTFLSIDGIEEPIHFSEMSIEEANIVERVKQRFCDEHNLYLTEYDETTKPPMPYKSLDGRTRQEMEKYRKENKE